MMEYYQLSSTPLFHHSRLLVRDSGLSTRSSASDRHLRFILDKNDGKYKFPMAPPLPEPCKKNDEKMQASRACEIQMINRILFPMQLDTEGHSYYLKNK